MTYLIEIPVDSGGRMLVQPAKAMIAREPELAATGPSSIVRVAESLEKSLARLKPALAALHANLVAPGAAEVSVEFGILLGVESDLVVASGKSEVHFTVHVTWPGTRPAATADQA
ncbi:CU044_2847 family protein [Catellatospora vulcania]|uniref:CU044_2847 family protein n=1 Tax=Catellatospora vulcania TaxID=1460450 RepID=UPI0012D43EFE|nr:CU044_2847 family protein [Catellatospora vulcania]